MERNKFDNFENWIDETMQSQINDINFKGDESKCFYVTKKKTIPIRVLVELIKSHFKKGTLMEFAQNTG